MNKYGKMSAPELLQEYTADLIQAVKDQNSKKNGASMALEQRLLNKRNEILRRLNNPQS